MLKLRRQVKCQPGSPQSWTTGTTAIMFSILHVATSQIQSSQKSGSTGMVTTLALSPPQGHHAATTPTLTSRSVRTRHFQAWATFHNVPWKGDSISIEWGIVKPDASPHPQSAYIDPYTQRNIDLGPLEPTTDPTQFLLILASCIQDRFRSPDSLTPSCASIIAQGSGVAIRLFVPRPAE